MDLVKCGYLVLVVVRLRLELPLPVEALEMDSPPTLSRGEDLDAAPTIFIDVVRPAADHPASLPRHD